MKFECPICGSKIRYKRVDDGETILEFYEDGINEIGSTSDGYTQVYCSKDESHKLSSDFIDKVIDAVEEEGY